MVISFLCVLDALLIFCYYSFRDKKNLNLSRYRFDLKLHYSPFTFHQSPFITAALLFSETQDNH